METKRNLKYFTSKGLTPLMIVALCVMLVGAILFFPWSTRFIGVILLVVGVGLAIFASGGKASGDDIEYQVAEKVKNMNERGMVRFELFQKSLKYLEPITMHGYEFNDEVYYKKGSDGKNRTNIYSEAILFFTGERIDIHRRRFSLTDDLLDEELGGTYKYIDLDHAEVQEHPFKREVGKHTVKFTDYHFVLIDAEGNAVLDMSVDYGADVDKACEDITRIIDIRKKAYAEKLARVEADRKARIAAAEAEAAAN